MSAEGSIRLRGAHLASINLSSGETSGDGWCLCAPRWQGAFEAGQAPRVVLRATQEGALEYCELADLKRFAIDLS